MDESPRTPGCPEAEVGPLLDDQSRCWGAGTPLPVEAYLERHPDLVAADEAVLDLIYHEILLRTRRGEMPARDEYLRRFPRFAQQLSDQFDVHQALFPTTPRATVAGTGAPVPGPEDTSPAAPLPSVPGYEILGELGRGGMGVVYQARQVNLKRLVALKMIQSRAHAGPGQLARFRSEAETLARLQHPNIVQVYEVGEHDGLPFFSLEFLTGGGLDHKTRGAPQPPADAAHLIETLARAVHAAHEARIVHRDLKPANILLAADGTPKISDFGLAKSLDATSDQTRSGDILGTPSYMAPEQARGQRGAVGPEADVYALGAILYELLTGRPPFLGATIWDTLEQVAKRDPVPLRQLQPRCPRDLETICSKCLDKDPKKRYATARELADDLGSFLKGEPIRARPAPPWERAWLWARRRPAGVAVGALVLLAVLVVLSARKAHLEAQVSRALLGEREANRRAALAGAETGLARVEVAINAQQWEKASAGVEGLLLQLRGAREQFPADPGLAQLQLAARRRRDQAARRLTDQDRYRRFGNCRDDAGFERIMGCGGGGPGRARTRALVAEALGLFHVGIEEGGPLPPESSYLTEAQKREVREGCCELLLDLARVEAEPEPGAGPAEQRRRAERARRILERAAGLGVPGAVYHWRRADCLDRLGQGQAARAERELARSCPLTTASDFFLRGGDLYGEGQVAAAARHFDRALTLDPNHHGAHYALAVCYLKRPAAHPDLRQAHLALARSHLTFCIYQQPRRLWPYLLRGFALGELGEFKAARADFARVEEALELEPNEGARYGLLVNRGVMHIRSGDVPEAVADLTRAVRLRPDDYPAHVNLAQAYQEQRQEKKAGEHLDRAVALRPPQAAAAVYRTRARWRLRQGDLPGALRDLGQALRHESNGPSSAEAAGDRVERGRLLVRARRYEEGVHEFDAALAARPDDPDTHRLRAEALLHLGRDAEALPSLDRALAGDEVKGPGRAALHRARARARARAGDHAGAAEDYTHALGLGAADADSHAARGWTYLVLEAPGLALRDFESALKLRPGDGDARTGHGYALVKLGRYREGVLDAERALDPAPRARTCYNAARVLAQAAVRAESDSALPAPRARDLGAVYRDRALELLGRSLDLLPPGERPAFWREAVQRDAALNPVRRSPAFRQLARAHAPRDGPPSE